MASRAVRWKIVVPISLFVAAAVIMFAQNQQNRYAITSAKGSITEGRRFGINIEDRVDLARRALEEQGFQEVVTPERAHEMNYRYANEYVFLGRGWRGGVVWLKQSNGVVTEIGWRYDLGAKLP